MLLPGGKQRALAPPASSPGYEGEHGITCKLLSRARHIDHAGLAKGQYTEDHVIYEVFKGKEDIATDEL